jgi:hypothetical protein
VLGALNIFTCTRHIESETTLALPGLAFLDIAHDRANGFAARQQGAGHRTADLAGYSRDGASALTSRTRGVQG